MKYAKHYLSLTFVDNEQDEMGFVDLLSKMQAHDSFTARFIDVDDPKESDKIDFNAKQFHVEMKSIVVAPKRAGLQIKIVIDQGVPDGIIPGTYELIFRDGDCDDLPERMFYDGEVEVE